MPAPVVRMDTAVLRQALGAAVVLREGMTIGGRVAELRGRMGILMLRGAPVLAELPPGLRAGQALRLLVAGREGEKVVLRIVPDEAHAAQQQHGQPVPAVGPWSPLPGGARARVEERDAAPQEEEGDGGERPRSVTVRFEGPALGPVDLRLELDPGGAVRTTVRAAPGALAALRAAAGELGGEVRLEPRDEEVDLRA
jgi:hypothetical protein